MAQHSGNAEHDAEALYKAMKGLGTDDKILISILTERSTEHLQEVKKAYEKKYGKTLETDIKGDTSGYYEDLLVALLQDHQFYLAGLVMEAIKGLGTDEQLLIDVICTKSDAELKDIANAFTKRYGKDMLKEVADDLSGDLKKMILSLFEFKRGKEGPADMDLAKKDAKLLYDKGEGTWGTDEDAFIKIFASRTRSQLEATSKVYADLAGHTLEVAVEKETSGWFKKTMLALVCPLPEYWGNKFHKAMKGVGTDEKALIRMLIGLPRGLLKEINQYYTHKYSHSLHKDIESDVSGDFGKTILAIVPRVA